MEYHPYNREVSSDHFYIDLCNDIQHEILHVDVHDCLVGADYKFLACMLACYFEDTVSRSGIWTSFIDEHHKLYGKYLPFCDMAGYERGEINLADIQFLIWHFCSNLSVKSRFIDPYSLEKAEIARVVHALLNENVAEAPANADLNATLTLPPDADFGAVIKRLDFFFFGCYAHRYYTSTLLEEEMLNVKNQKGAQEEGDNRRLRLLFNRVSPLLAQRAGEMTARWIGEAHPLYKSLMSLSKRKEGLFLYEGATPTHYKMRHIASGTLVELMRPDWKIALEENKSIVRAGIVQWDGQWRATGPAFPVAGINHDELTERERCLFSAVESHLGVVRRQEECFLEASGNKRILYLDSKREAFFFIDHVWEIYHQKYGMDSMDRKMFDVHAVTFDVDEDLENIAVFFNPRAGMEFYPDAAQLIFDTNNPYFCENAETNIEDLFFSERISSDFIAFLVKNKMIDFEPITGSGGFHYVVTDCDFLLRYWKKERYESEPVLYIE